MYTYVYIYIHMLYIYTYTLSDSIVLGILVHDVYISMLATCKCCGTFQESINLLEEMPGGKNRCHILEGPTKMF